MSSPSRRTRMLIGGFVTTAAMWGVDWLTGTKPTKSADASDSLQKALAAIPTSQPVLDVDKLIAQVKGVERSVAEPSGNASSRNPFQSAGMLAELERLPAAANNPPPLIPTTTTTSDDARPELAFHGVITGQVELALIGRTVVGVGGSVEGFEVVEIARDFVRLRKNGETLTLRLAHP